MAEDQDSLETQETPQQKQARRKMAEVVALFAKKPEQGVEMMRDLLEMYPDYIPARQWLADHYEATEQTRKAVTQYEEMLRLDRENDEIWEGLRRVDPATAGRLERLRHLAPDPFVKQKNASGSSDLDDFEDFEEEEPEEIDSAKARPFHGDTAGDDIFLDDNGDDDYGYEPPGWMYEQDPEYRDRLESNPGFMDALAGFNLFWDDPQGWSTLLGECLAPADADWGELDEILPAAAGSLSAPPPTVLVFPEHTHLPLSLPLTNATLVVGETLRMALNQQETLFVLGFGINGLMNESAQFMWAAQHVAERDIEDCELRLRVVRSGADFAVGWDEGMPREETTRVAKLCHAWELRAVISADRAGLIACGSSDAACRAIAALVGDPGEAGLVSVEEFLAQFKDVPPAELAAIPLSHDPWTDPQYAAYRIQMLRWWATTDEFKSLS